MSFQIALEAKLREIAEKLNLSSPPYTSDWSSAVHSAPSSSDQEIVNEKTKTIVSRDGAISADFGK